MSQYRFHISIHILCHLRDATYAYIHKYAYALNLATPPNRPLCLALRVFLTAGARSLWHGLHVHTIIFTMLWWVFFYRTRHKNTVRRCLLYMFEWSPSAPSHALPFVLVCSAPSFYGQPHVVPLLR